MRQACRSPILICLIAVVIVLSSFPASAQRVLDQYQIRRSSMSFDGRYVAFEFFETRENPRRFSDYRIAVYDTVDRQIEIHVAPSPRNFHSPSLSPDGRFIAVIQRCWSTDCNARELGLQVGIIDRETRAFRLLTTDETRITERGEYGPRRILHGLPVFGVTEPVIYFTYLTGVGGTRPGGPRGLSKNIGEAGRSSGVGFADLKGGSESYLSFSPSRSITQIGRLSDSQKGLYIYAPPRPFGAFEDTTSWSFIATRPKFSLAPVFPDEPYYEVGSSGQANFRTYSLSSSADGSRVVFGFVLKKEYAKPGQKIGSSGMYLAEKGKIVKVFQSPDGFPVKEVAISGDGKQAVMFNFNKSDTMWVANIEGDQITSHALRHLFKQGDQ
jgi:hypothetical protein